MKAWVFSSGGSGGRPACSRLSLSQLEQRVVEDAHQHLAGALALGLGHVRLHELGDRLQAAGGLAASAWRARRRRTAPARGRPRRAAARPVRAAGGSVACARVALAPPARAAPGRPARRAGARSRPSRPGRRPARAGSGTARPACSRMPSRNTGSAVAQCRPAACSCGTRAPGRRRRAACS